jgi:putative DNA primase/helicase
MSCFTPCERFLARLQDVTGERPTRNGDGWKARCPSHFDRNPSLSISEGADGRVLVKCFAGCDVDAIVAALGLTTSDLFPARDSQRNGRPGRVTIYATLEAAISAIETASGGKEVGRWDYQYADSSTAFVVVRIDGARNGKSYRPIRPHADGWAIGDPVGPLPLYRLGDLADANPVFVVEGERCVESARAIGLTATTSAHGANSPRKTDWTVLAGREVVIVPDNDDAGRSYADVVAGLLANLAPPAQVRILDLPDLPEGGDIVDFLRARESESPDRLRSEIESLADAAPCGTCVRPSPGASVNSWPDPEPLPNEISPVMEFDSDFLPVAFRAWVNDIAERIQCPVDFPAAASMVALAAVVGRRIGIRPKRQDDWTVVPNLWGGLVGRPGIMKTPALQESIKPIKRLEIKAKEDHEAAVIAFNKLRLVGEQQEKIQKEKIKKAIKDGAQADAKAMAEKLVGEDVPKPVRRRYMTNDCTTEKLGEILNENENGVLVVRDELVGFFRSHEKDGRECDRAFYLECWNGDGRFTYDRIGRGTIDIKAAIVSILGGIQPGPLSEYLRGALSNGLGDDGLIQRFQLLVWPDIPRDWRNVDRWPNRSAKETAYSAFVRLDALDPAEIGACVDDKDHDAIPFLRFSDDAQVEFDRWRADLECKLRSDDEHPAIESHLAKYRSLVPSLSLLVHLVDGHYGPVCLGCLQRALAWGKYLESHARRVYSVAVDPAVSSAKSLAGHLRRGDLKDGFTLRDIYRHCWTGLTTSEDASRAVGLLIDLGWLKEVSERTGGAPKTTYSINRKIFDTLGKGTVTTDKSPKLPSTDPFGGFVRSPTGGSESFLGPQDDDVGAL